MMTTGTGEISIELSDAGDRVIIKMPTTLDEIVLTPEAARRVAGFLIKRAAAAEGKPEPVVMFMMQMME